ncbi:O-antigen ligase-like membrane protein [Flavobacterium sp. 90]|uniref:O-antigen ligase family protein n=1 Tax=unclassified Flavobacterium TaxID=196869 RepID=UPI000EB0D4E8|nr:MULTISPECIES: O-antigen ligase family protein [unclassified Flavobacterium]RKR10960.1 O-antigen ligase-like membrane protein [Flavobacterium sp. 81]TCK54745.1 O-antigen ligase-like membrane protein [Flavobacterium sp. 90]
MKSFKLSYVYLLIIHAVIGLAVFAVPFLSKIYALIIPLVGLLLVFRTKNKNNEVLFVAAYLVGVEVFLRMTGGNFNNEYVKFNVIFFMFLGMVYSNFSRNGIIYLLLLLLLIPAILVTTNNLDFNFDIRKALVFNLSGPVCLVFSALYMFKRRILFSDLQRILSIIGLPIVTTTIYLFLYNPSVKDVVTGTQSNFETSGGFGPNQVSTILGLGIFIFFTQLILFSKSKFEMFINGSLLLFISYRGVVTFSRGGVITAVVMVVFLLFLLYYFSNDKGKVKFTWVFILTGLMGIGIWTYSSFQTSGLINKRYANQDQLGRVKKDRLGGREGIMDAEIKLFLDNPILGVGAGLSKYKRIEELGEEIASHNEITRMLSEHGLFGIFGLLILFITPVVLYINNKQHLYFFSFYVFWLLTINHAAMRIAAPAFVYGLTLLSVQIKIPEKAENSVD